MTKLACRIGLILGLTLFAISGALGQSRVYKLFVDGLACPFCSYGVEKKITGLNGVDKIDIDLDAGFVAVTMAGGATLDEEAARRAVDQAGFTLRRFEAPEKE